MRTNMENDLRAEFKGQPGNSGDRTPGEYGASGDRTTVNMDHLVIEPGEYGSSGDRSKWVSLVRINEHLDQSGETGASGDRT